MKENDFDGLVKRQLFVLLSLLLASGLAGCLGGGQVGEPLRSFDVVTLDGQAVNQTTYEGQWLVLDLMATWCPPCKDQTRHLQDVEGVLGDRVAILSISTDPTETIEDMEQFAEEFGVHWPHALDPAGKVGRTFDVTRIPLVLVVDPDGVVVEQGEGGLLPAAIIKAIDPTLAPPGVSLPVAPFLVGVGAGLVAWLNPYRRMHREGGRGALLVGAAVFALLGFLAWEFANWISARITIGGFLVGAISLVAVAWWFRARRKEVEPSPPSTMLAAGDRVYEGAPHFTLALALGLTATSVIAFAAPIAGFLVGIAASIWVTPRLPQKARVWIGLAGLAAVGLALVAFGAPLVLGELSAA